MVLKPLVDDVYCFIAHFYTAFILGYQMSCDIWHSRTRFSIKSLLFDSIDILNSPFTNLFLLFAFWEIFLETLLDFILSHTSAHKLTLFLG